MEFGSALRRPVPRRGVCQDFAHLQIACLRSLGLPAGYISGYLRTLPSPGLPRLVGADASHAWCSAWCGSISIPRTIACPRTVISRWHGGVIIATSVLSTVFSWVVPGIHWTWGWMRCRFNRGLSLAWRTVRYELFKKILNGDEAGNLYVGSDAIGWLVI